MTDNYFSRSGIRATHLKALAKGSPLHYRHSVDNPQAGRTASRTALQANHCAILEPDRFATDYAAWTGKTRRGKAWDQWQADHPGVTGLSAREHAEATRIGEAVRSHPVAGPMVCGAQYIEHTHSWQHLPTFLPCLMRADLIKETGQRVLLGDVKAVESTDIKAITRQAYRLGWPLQMAHYRDGVQDMYGYPVRPIETSVALICVESSAPHDVAVVYLSDELMEHAAAEHSRLLRIIERCRQSGVWPGRHLSAEVMDLPPWLEPQLMDSRGAEQ